MLMPACHSTPAGQVDGTDASMSAANTEHSTQPSFQQQQQLQLLAEVVAALKSGIAAGHAATAHLHVQAPPARNTGLATAAAPLASGPWASTTTTSSSSTPGLAAAGASSAAADVVEEARRWRNRWLRGLLLCAPGEGSTLNSLFQFDGQLKYLPAVSVTQGLC
jgi:hypothetical protein